MKTFKKVLSILINIVLWSLLAVSTILVISLSFVKIKGNRPMVMGFGFFQIVSGSMEPEVKVGDVIIAKKISASDINEGDNLVFTYDNKIITHKLIKKNVNGTLIMHGIANADGSNETINFSQVIGKQVFKLPKLGYALNFMRSPFGFMFIIILPIGGLIIYQTVILTKRLRLYKKQNGNEEKEQIKAEIDILKAKLETNDKEDKIKDLKNDEK